MSGYEVLSTKIAWHAREQGQLTGAPCALKGVPL